MNWITPLALILLPFQSYCQNQPQTQTEPQTQPQNQQQPQPPTCTDLRETTVYTRSQDKHQPYKIIINGPTLKQINLATGDSSNWQIQWVEQCGFTMKFLSGNDTLTPGQQHFAKHHLIAIKIDNTTPDYYLYTVYRDRIGHQLFTHDTLWVHEQGDRKSTRLNSSHSS